MTWGREMQAGRWLGAVIGLHLICAAIAAAEGRAASRETIPPQVRNAESCLVQIFGVFEGKWQATGTGFLVSKEGHILTSSKGVERATEVLASGPALGEQPIKVREIDSNSEAGVSLLKADVPNETPCLSIHDSVRLTQGDFAYAAGLGGEGLRGVVGYVRAMILGTRTFAARGHMIQFDRAFPSTFVGGPILSGDGAVLGVIASQPDHGPAHAGWGVPSDATPVRALLDLNRVPYEKKYGVGDYATWPLFLTFILLALLIYGVYVACVWRSKGREAALRRLPAKVVALCLLASAMAHLSFFVTVLVVQQRGGEWESGQDLTEVGVVNTETDGTGGGGGLPGDRSQPTGAPPKPVNLPPPAPVQPVDVDKKIREATQEKIKNVVEETAKADEESRLLTQKELEGAVAVAEDRSRKTSQAANNLQSNTKDLLKRLAEAGRGGGGDGGQGGGSGGGKGRGIGPGEGDGTGGGGGRRGGIDSREARTARWTISVPPSISYVAFVDKHGGELATVSSDDPSNMFYVSDTTRGQKKTRTGPVSAETRMHWAPEGPVDYHRMEQVGAFLSVGRRVGLNDPIVTFFSPAFEEKLARMEKEFRARMNLPGPPTRTIFAITQNLEPVVESSD